MKFNASLELEWQRVYPHSEGYNFPESVVVHEDGTISFTSYNNILGIDSMPAQKFRVINLDPYGEVLDEFIGEEDFFGFYQSKTIQAPDGGFITTQDSCWNYPVLGWAWDCITGMRKYNADWEEEWRLQWWEIPQKHSEMRAVTYASDSLGVVAVGKYLESGVSEFTRLVKVSWEGEKIWERVMSYPETEYVDYIEGAYPSHVITTSDGGYLISGNILYGVNFTDQWLMKVDEHGCLVPGCQNVTTKDEVGNEVGYGLLVAPNPASEQLNIFARIKEGTEGHTLVVHDLQGHEVYKEGVSFDNLTKTIDVSSWMPGMYIVSLYQENLNLVIREKVVVSGRK